LILYTYFRSSAAYRVRIALALKGLKPELRFIHLVKGGGQQHSPEYRALNPQGRVPFLIDGATKIGQSLAIIEYLDETHPQPALLPRDAAGRARVRQIALAITADIQPLQNLSTTQYLERELGLDQPARDAWVRHWIDSGLAALEATLAADPATGRFCHGDAPTMADCCLVPQLFAARRFGADLARCPTLARIDAACTALPAFAAAAPAAQPDAE
jgi:maleylacetoacetate isomerase